MKYVEDGFIVADYLADKAGDEAALETIGRMNAAVSEFVDDYCNRRRGYFLPANNSTTARNFRGAGKNFLQIPVHVAGTVSVDNVAASLVYENTTNGWIYALGANSISGDASNISTVYDDCGNFFIAGQLYVVRARWGYAATPAAVSEAVKQIVARWFDVQHGVLGQVTPGGFVIERDMPPSAKSLLKKYVKREFEID